MNRSVKRIILRLLFWGNIGCILLLLAGNAAPWLEPGRWWPVALAGMFFPLMVVAVFLFFFFWLMVRPWKSVFSLLALLVSIPNCIITFGFAIPLKFNPYKKEGDIRIVTWNTGLMNYTAPDSNTAIRKNEIIFQKLRDSDADIICLQEFFTAVVPGHHLNFIDSIAKMTGLPYHYFSFDVPKFEGKFYSGTILFSRFALTDTQRIAYPEPFAGCILKAGVVTGGDTIDIMTTRLQSVHFERDDYRALNNLKSGSEGGLPGAKNIIHKLRQGYRQRMGQVKMLKELIRKSNRPLVVTGDINDVPVSYTYAEIRNDLNDAWIKKGSGLGRTFIYISPTLRIDQVFYSDHFEARQVDRILSGKASDHNGLVTDLVLKK